MQDLQFREGSLEIAWVIALPKKYRIGVAVSIRRNLAS
jgi:hypothetical protein